MHLRNSRRILCAGAVVWLAVASVTTAAERYVRATVTKSVQLRIETTDGRAIVLSKEPEQVGFDRIAIAEDGLSVGWLALFPNCCTSYPIPLKLLVYSRGKLRTFTGDGLPIWRWHFTSGGRRIAFRQETVHGGLGVHYELRDVTSGRLISQFTPTVGPDNQPVPNQKVPSWVAAFVKTSQELEAGSQGVTKIESFDTQAPLAPSF